MKARDPRWAHFANAAVQDQPANPDSAGPLRGARTSTWLRGAGRSLAVMGRKQGDVGPARRVDIRLLPAVVATWVGAAVAIGRPWPFAAAGTVLCLIVGLAAVLVLWHGRLRSRAVPRGALWTDSGDTRTGEIGESETGQDETGECATGQCGTSGDEARQYKTAHSATGAGETDPAPAVAICVASDRAHSSNTASNGTGAGAGAAVRTVAASALTVLTAAVCLGMVLLAVALGQRAAANQPLAKAIARGEELALTLQVGSTPRPVDSPGGTAQVTFDAVVLEATARGSRLAGHVDVRVVAGQQWAGIPQGGTVSTAGTVAPAEPSDSVSGYLRPATAPLDVRPPRGFGPETFRTAWSDAARGVWARTSPDAAALLPGMVMGDRSHVDLTLNQAMKTAGLTHLTAVSGENCTLVLAALMLVLRSVHTPRVIAGAVAVLGLAVFVAIVGPDPSVLRAAVMGAIGCAAILGGRPKRVGALLSISIVVLLVGDPWLALDYAFILSVLATLGLHLVGRRLTLWLGLRLPAWLAQAVAIPAAAQLFCAPVIVLLQARLTPYTVPANVLAAPVVALVTTVGTLGLAVAPLLPALAGICAASSGLGAWWVAAIARWCSALPAASLPWPSGAKGATLMALFNAGVLAALLGLAEWKKVSKGIHRFQARLPPRWRPLLGFGSFTACMALGAGLWTAAMQGQ
jgi:competence protein ComEC